MIGFRVYSFLGLTPTGRDISLQFNIPPYLTRGALSTPMTPSELLKKFTFNPEISSKHQSMLLMIMCYVK